MKLFKGVLAIAILTFLFTSCKDAKKETEATKDKVETVADGHNHKTDAKKCGADCKKACCAKKEEKKHVCDATCKEKGCTAHKADDKAHVCDATCKEKGCTAHKADAKAHVCDATCKEKGCTAHKADTKAHKCDAVCKEKGCTAKA
jgi:hypothetical protein